MAQEWGSVENEGVAADSVRECLPLMSVSSLEGSQGGAGCGLRRLLPQSPGAQGTERRVTTVWSTKALSQP